MSSSSYPEAEAIAVSSYSHDIPEGTVVHVSASAPPLSSSQTHTSLRYLSSSNHRNSSFYNPNVSSTINDGSTRTFLTSKGWPQGLQDFLIHNVATKLPYRFFICDDSGSMVTNDGKRLYDTRSGTPPKIVKCSRWTELVEALRFHVSLADALNLHSEFRLLNGSQPVIVGGPESNTKVQL